MNGRKPLLVILGLAALALGAGIGTLVGETNQPEEVFGSAPKSLAKTQARVQVPALPTAAAIPTLHTVTIETTAPEEGGEAGSGEAEEGGTYLGGSEYEEPESQPVEEKIEKKPINEPAPHPTVKPEVTIGESE